MLVPYGKKQAVIDKSVFVAPGAFIIGDVTIGEQSSVWFNAVMRGDEGPIVVGKRTSIQDNSTLHLYEGQPLTIGDEVTVGHNAILHGCTIGNRSIIGMGSTILDGAEIGEECIIGANTLISPGKENSSAFISGRLSGQGSEGAWGEGFAAHSAVDRDLCPKGAGIQGDSGSEITKMLVKGWTVSSILLSFFWLFSYRLLILKKRI